MNKYYLIVSAIFLALSLSCGKNPNVSGKKNSHPDKKVTEHIKDNSPNKDVKLVDADEFAKAFSRTLQHPVEEVHKETKSGGSAFFQAGALVKNRFSNQLFKQNTPPDTSLAAKIGGDKHFSWLPKWDFSGKGGVRIPDSTISSDNSLIAVLNNVSGDDEVISTLLVLINTYNFNINAIYYFPGKLLTKIKLLSSLPGAVVWEKKQKGDASGQLHTVDLLSGKITGSSKNVNSDIVNFAIRGDDKKMLLKTGNRKKVIYLFDLEHIANMPESIECTQEEGRLAVSGDNSLFALAGKKSIEIFKFSDNMKLEDIGITLKTVPDCFIFTDDNTFAMLSYMQPFFLVTDGAAKQLSPSSGRRLFLRNDIHAIAFEEYKNKAISLVDLKSLEKIDSFSPEKLKPKTHGSALLLTYLPHLKKYLLLDSLGNLSLFYRPGKKWRKNLIFSAEK
jgi:hypothetical protein